MLRRLAGHHALDFANTVDPREGKRRVEYLKSFADLMDWARRGGVVDARAARLVRRESSRHRAAAARAFARAIALREAVYVVFSAVVARDRVPAKAVAELERACRE